VPEFDLSLPELESYRPEVPCPADFDAFWRRTLDEARGQAAPPVATPVDNGLATVTTFDVTFSGFGGQPVKAWLHVPAGATRPLPAVVEFEGYSIARRLPWENHRYADAGFAHLLLDTRGQGWQAYGATPDLAPEAGLTTVPGMMTKGIGDPATYYYRRLYTDAVRLVDTARQLPQIDPDRVAVTGVSQGGGVTIAAAGLSDGLAGAAPDVPFLCHFERATAITDKDPYHELVAYYAVYRDRVDQAKATLAYFDGVNLAARASCPALFSTALRDETCPPSTVFAAYHAWAGQDKAIEVYRYNGHEGGGEHHAQVRQAFLRRVLA
jgi:cephalosporin-C deacetylase